MPLAFNAEVRMQEYGQNLLEEDVQVSPKR